MRPARLTLLDTLLPQLSVPIPTDGALKWQGLFGRPVTQLWLEVGFGVGEHLAWQAKAQPTVGFIGCEPYLNGVASLLRSVDQEALENVRIHPDDALQVIEALPPQSVSRCFILFPDPWPKAKHHRRRFIQPASLDALARILCDGAELRLASDDPGMVDWMLFHTRAHPAFSWSAKRAQDWRTPTEDWPTTRYEQKRMRGRPVFLRFLRTARTRSP